METKKISEFVKATSLTGGTSEYHVILQNGINKIILTDEVNRLDKLFDVDISTVDDGNFLMYSGETWVINSTIKN